MLINRTTIKKLWLYVAVILIGLFFVVAIPPFQKADESYHYRNMLVVVGRIRALMSGQPGLKIYKEEYELNKRMMSVLVTSGSHVKFPVSLYKSHLNYKNQNLMETESKLNLAVVIQYLPAAIGYLMGFGYPLIGYFLARSFSLLFFLGCLLGSYIFLSKTKYTRLLVIPLLVPMLWHQVAGITYDSTFISLLLLTTALFIKVSVTGKFSRIDKGLILVLTVLVSLVKTGNDVFLFLLLLLPWQKHGGNWFRSKILPLLPVIIFILVILIAKRSPLAMVAIQVDNGVKVNNQIVNSEVNKLIIFSDWEYVCQLLANTILTKSEFYMRSFIGQFGWLDVEMEWWIYPVIMLIISYFFMKLLSDIKKSSLAWWQLVVLGLILWGYIGMVFLGMYLWWTPAALGVIEGIQGRYFLPIFPLMLFWLTELIVKIGKKQVRKILLIIMIVTTMASLSWSVYGRYYDYSRLYQNPENLSKEFEDTSKKNKIVEKKLLDQEVVVSLPTDGNKFAGFQLLVEPAEETMIPLRYSLEDGNGKVLQKGYLNNKNIENGVLQGEFLIKSTTSDRVQLKLVPLLTGDGKNYIYLLENFATLLFISK